MKKYLYIISIALISLSAVFMIYRMINASSDQEADPTDLTDKVVESLIKTTADKKITVLSKSKQKDSVLVFYLDLPKSPSDHYNIKKTDVGFAFFKKTSNKWSNEHSSEYGSIEAYLNKTEKGYTYDFFPSDEDDISPIIFGVIADPKIKEITMNGSDSGQEQSTNYIDSNEIRIWYSFLEEPFNESFTITASGSDKELSKETINLGDYKSSSS